MRTFGLWRDFVEEAQLPPVALSNASPQGERAPRARRQQPRQGESEGKTSSAAGRPVAAAAASDRAHRGRKEGRASSRRAGLDKRCDRHQNQLCSER